jgi:acetyl/propionyl-CoA carboxylase alpha subunit
MEVKVRIDGVDHRAQAQLLSGTLWVHYNGRCFTLETGGGAKPRKRSGPKGSSDQVVAPMPGKVTKIIARLGAQVSQGEPILVMEAMKMEYTLKAEITGKIEVVDCSVGEQVQLGKVLAKIKPLEAK